MSQKLCQIKICTKIKNGKARCSLPEQTKTLDALHPQLWSMTSIWHLIRPEEKKKREELTVFEYTTLWKFILLASFMMHFHKKGQPFTLPLLRLLQTVVAKSSPIHIWSVQHNENTHTSLWQVHIANLWRLHMRWTFEKLRNLWCLGLGGCRNKEPHSSGILLCCVASVSQLTFSSTIGSISNTVLSSVMSALSMVSKSHIYQNDKGTLSVWKT